MLKAKLEEDGPILQALHAAEAKTAKTQVDLEGNDLGAGALHLAMAVKAHEAVHVPRLSATDSLDMFVSECFCRPSFAGHCCRASHGEVSLLGAQGQFLSCVCWFLKQRLLGP